MKTTVAVLTLISAGIVQASTGTITFNGQLTDTTCIASVNVLDGTGGAANGTVTLPTISVTDLDSAGKTAGMTRFKIMMSNCSGTLSSVSTWFEGAGTDGNGRLINNGTAGNVVVELWDATANTRIQAGHESQYTSNYWQPRPSGPLRMSTLFYAVRYYATDATTPGSVATRVNYTLMYK
jgi:major type 1 subunit fimbrin (pilin)